MAKGTQEKTYQFLIRSLDRQIDMNVRDKNYAALQGRATAAPTPKKTRVCKAYLRGECNDRNCPRAHPDGKKGSKATSAATPQASGGTQRAAGRQENRGRSQSQGRGKGKGKGKGKARSASPTHNAAGLQILGDGEMPARE